MAKAMYIGISNVARKVNQPYIGVAGVARKAVKGYVGVGNVARQFYSGGIGALEVGTSVYLNVNGASTEFMIVHQGIPDETYSSSCDGTWLLMKDLYTSKGWNISSGMINYSNSTMHKTWLKDFFNVLDDNIQSIIKTVKIPYGLRGATSAEDTVYSGENGLSTQVFLLANREVGGTAVRPTIGTALAYFADKKSSTYDSYRIAYLNGTATAWWLRNPQSSNSICTVGADGSLNSGSGVTSLFGIRPAFILPSDTLVDSDFNVIA